MKKKLELLRKKFEFTAMAVTYAEAGEWDIAADYMAKIDKLNQSKKPKMMVVALDSEFSSDTVEYSVNFAERMQYDLLAVNAVKQAKQRSLQRMSHKQLTKKLKHIFSSMVERAQASKIPCETFITINDLRSQIRQLIKRVKRVELVLVQVKKGQQISLNLEIPVYQIEVSNA